MISLFFILLSLSYYQAVSGVCTFNFDTDVPETNRPIYMTKRKNGLGTEVLNLGGQNRAIELQETGEKKKGTWTSSKDFEHYTLILVCTGESNKIRKGTKLLETQAVELICKNNEFLSDSEQVNVKELACDQQITIKLELVPKITLIPECEGDVRQLVYSTVVDFLPPKKTLREVNDPFRELVSHICSDYGAKQPYSTFHRVYKESISNIQRTPLKQVEGEDSSVEHLMVPEADLISFPGINVDKKPLDELTILMKASISKNNMFKVEKYIREEASKNENGIGVHTWSIDWKGISRNPSNGPSIVVKLIKTDKTCFALVVVTGGEILEEYAGILENKCEDPTLNDETTGRVLCLPVERLESLEILKKKDIPEKCYKA